MILYSFRRCPFAIRARMALVYSGIDVELREVNLSDLPKCLLALSPKATVPVLLLNDRAVIDESLDVMLWSLSQSDPDRWLEVDRQSWRLIEDCDNEFKLLLDCYKYSDRHPELSLLEHRIRAETFLSELEQVLSNQVFLTDSCLRLTDIAIFPFIRQFAGVEPAWFESCEFSAVRGWLNRMLQSELFKRVMSKKPIWQPGNDPVSLLN